MQLIFICGNFFLKTCWIVTFVLSTYSLFLFIILSICAFFARRRQRENILFRNIYRIKLFVRAEYFYAFFCAAAKAKNKIYKENNNRENANERVSI